jgi:hypothetical protein
MGADTGNFGFLNANSPKLAKLGRLAERYFADDPLVKTRGSIGKGPNPRGKKP